MPEMHAGPVGEKTASVNNEPVADTEIESILARFLEYHPKSIDLSLDRIRRLMNDLGNPQNKVPPVIHVAGTNGKGSTIAFLRSIMEAHGYTCHAFTSPHLIRFNERIRLSGKLISNTFLKACLIEAETVNAGREITFFELTYAAAFIAFSKVPADFLLLETGMGGRLDATNIVENPLLTIITRISMDHAEFLGDTLEKIAFEKAGIMKPAVPCVIAPQTTQNGVNMAVMDVFAKHAEKLKVPLHRVESENSVYPELNLTGPHQRENAATALQAMEILNENYPDRFHFEEKKSLKGLEQAYWPARLQRLQSMERKLQAPMEAEIWLDGGHNDSAGEALAKQAKIWNLQDQKTLHLVIGMINTKNPETFLKSLLPMAKSLSLIPVPEEKSSHDPKDVRKQLKPLLSDLPEIRCSVFGDAEDAVAALFKEDQNRTCRVLITGSLYLSGHIMKTLKDEVV